VDQVNHGDHDPPWWTRSVQDHLGACSDISLMFDEGEDGLGQAESMPEVVGGSKGGGEPVPQPSNKLGGVEELSFQFNAGPWEGGPFAGGSPIDEFSSVDREGHTNASTSCSDGGEKSLQLVYLPPVGGGGHGY